MCVLKDVGKSFWSNIHWFHAYCTCAFRKKAFGTGTKGYIALLALASVCHFYQLRMFIKRKRLRLISYGILF